MRNLIIAAAILGTASLGAAVEFLGVELCRGAVNTSVRLPEGSGLTISSVEIGDRGALMMLLEGRADALIRLDDVMAAETGVRGTGSDAQLQWSGNTITALAQVLKKGQVALVVSTTDDCAGEEVSTEPTQPPPVAPAPVPEEPDTSPPATQATEAPQPGVPDAGMSATTAAIAAASAPPAPAADPLPEEVAPPEDFELSGEIRHALAMDGWVDVMGVVSNHSDDDYRLATFDVAFFDAADQLMCVDTISVTQLGQGRTRAFRDSIECAAYDAESVARIELHFAGGY